MTVKTAFLTLLYNDNLCIMDSETEIDRRYTDWAHFKKGGIFLALKGLHIPAQGNALGNY